ncbi:S8 family serine peptidase [Natronolimnohabitans sp. A-GB9]|uniref:S8 family serine peptidase n=1 Tax=Natronolimnohabitans sp. A-GB9 TaxID=3069757 RepID=UPI0027B44CDB|nr:S8 family serine peptidase [Natronolimnohabitans sp. A-GB9]MDQ2050823.1 S8 family serine peptidase [Natronolimnohabitans sp. A-GB9]
MGAPVVASDATGGEPTPYDTDESTLATAEYDPSTTDPAPSSDVTIDENVPTTQGTVDVLVSVEAVDVPLLQSESTDVADSLKTHAETSQEPLVEYAEETDGLEVQNQFWITNTVLLEVDLETVDLEAVASQDGVERIEKNYAVQTPKPVESDSTEAIYGPKQIGAPDVWETYGTMGDGSTVAVLDSGVDPTHPDIEISDDNWAEFDDDGSIVDSEPHDDHSHGTHVSGTVTGGNASGEYIGVAPNATLLHGAVIPGGTGSMAQVIAGIEWAVEEDADVVTMSLGLEEYAADFIEAGQNANAAGTTVVASTGNDGVGTSSSPGNSYDEITVGATNEDAAIASFSGGEEIETSLVWGADTPEEWPETYVVPTLVAPGVDVKSATPDGEYEVKSGTSMAAPHVAGTTALMTAAADETPPPEDVRSALESTAWKPADEPDEPDIRYGHGVVDAKAATDRVAAQQGVTGTVTDATGDPIEGATVSLESGFETTTDERGEYVVAGTEDVMAITVDRFGYSSESASVNVTGEYVTHNVTLDEHVDVRPIEAPHGAIVGGNTTFEIETAHAETLTADVEGDLDDSAVDLYVDGDEIDVGEPYEMDDPDGNVVVDLWIAADEAGSFSLEFEADGLGETATYEVSDLEIFEDTYNVGVVDTPDNEYGYALAAELDDLLPIRYDVSFVPTDEVMDSIDDYDTFVVQKFGEGHDYELAAEFFEATADPSTGVVYLDQLDEGAEWADSLHELSQATGTPTRVDERWSLATDEWDSSMGVYHVRNDHPIFDGVAEEGDTVELYSAVGTGEHAWFEEFNGEVLADVGWEGHEPHGQGLAVDDLRNDVYAASMGRTLMFGDIYGYSDDSDRILANSIKHVSGDAPMSIAQGQPDRVSPGESISVEFDVADLDKIAVDVNEEHTTVDAENLTLYIDDTVNAFGTYRGYSEPETGTVTVEVVPDEPVHGTIALEHDLVAADGERQSGNTGPTAIYEPPLEVPHDVETIQGGIDLAVGDDEVVVDDGVYEEQLTVRDGGMDGLTVRAAANASPTLVLPDETVEQWIYNIQVDDQEPVVYVRRTDDVTISGFEIDAGDEAGVIATQAANTTFSDLHVTNASTAIWSEFVAEHTTIENNTITDSDSGVFAHWSSDHNHIEGNDISAVETGIETDHVISDVDVLDNEVRNATTGYLIDGGGGHTDGNVAENVSRGLWLSTSGSVASLDDNVVRNAETGIRDASVNMPPTVTGNDIEARTGVYDSGWAGPPGYHLNDFSGSDQVIDSSQQIDAQLNYVGEQTTNESIVTDGVAYEPYLTDTPANVSGWETPQIGLDLSLEAGETYAVGIPGPTDQTVSEIVDDEAEGVIYGFDTETQTWEQRGPDDAVDPLDGLVVVAESDVHLSIEFRSPDTPASPGQAELEEGWNLVTPPKYGEATSAFEDGTFEPTLLQSPFASPDGQLDDSETVDGLATFDQDDSPRLSPFESYFVFVEADGTQPTRLASDPDAKALYETLGLEAPDWFDADADADAETEATTVEDVLESDLDDEQTRAALVEVITSELHDELDSTDESVTPVEQLTAVQTSADDLAANAPDEHRDEVSKAAETAVETVISVEFGWNVAHYDNREETMTDNSSSSTPNTHATG